MTGRTEDAPPAGGRSRLPHAWRVASTLLARLAGAGAALAFAAYVARALGPADAGRVFLCLNVQLGLSLVCRFGFDTNLMRFAGPLWEADDRGALRGLALTSLGLTTGLAGVASLAAYALSPILAVGVFDDPALTEPLRLAALGLTPFSLGFTLSGFLKGIRRPEGAGLLERTGVPVLALAVLWGAGRDRANPSTVLAAWAVGATLLVALALLGLAAWLGRRPPSAPPVTTQTLTASCVPLTWVNILNYVTKFSAPVVLGVLATAPDVGLFGIAQRLAGATSFILTAFNSVSAPSFPGLYQRGEMARLEHLSVRSTRLMCLAASPLVTAFVFAPRPVLSLFGPGFLAAAPYLVLLTLGQAVNLATGSVGYLLTMTGHERDVRDINVASAVGGLSLTVALTFAAGPLGAALATGLATAGQNLALAAYVRRRLHIRSGPF